VTIELRGPLVMAAAAAFGLALAAPAGAAERKLFENVGGWEVERNVGAGGLHPCQMLYAYKDKDDNDAENAIAVAFTGSDLILSLAYQNWGFDKDESVTAPISVDKTVLYPKQGWTGDGMNLRTVLPGAAIAKLAAGRKIILKFGNGTADFNIPGFGDAVAALKRCDAAPDVAAAPKAPSGLAAAISSATAPSVAPAVPAAPPVAATPAPMPSDTRIKVFAFGLFAQRVLAECDVATTTRQRTGIDGRIAALEPEMKPVATQLRDSIKADAKRCPPNPEAASEFLASLSDFGELSPEDFAAKMDRREAERAQKAAAAAPAPAIPAPSAPASPAAVPASPPGPAAPAPVADPAPAAPPPPPASASAPASATAVPAVPPAPAPVADPAPAAASPVPAAPAAEPVPAAPKP